MSKSFGPTGGGGAIGSANITDGSIVNADINAAAAIALTKLNISGTPTGSKFLRDDASWQTVASFDPDAATVNIGTTGATSTVNIGDAAGTLNLGEVGTYLQVHTTIEGPAASELVLLGTTNPSEAGNGARVQAGSAINAGVAGNLVLKGGQSGGASGTAGNATIDAGSNEGGTRGTVGVGTANAEVITIGNNNTLAVKVYPRVQGFDGTSLEVLGGPYAGMGSAGNILCDAGNVNGGTAGSASFGTSNASTVGLGNTTSTTTINGSTINIAPTAAGSGVTVGVNSAPSTINGDNITVGGGSTTQVSINSTTSSSITSDSEVYVGTGSGQPDVRIADAGSLLGFHGATPVAQQTGVAVTAAAIHAALVNLGLITA